MKFSRLLLYFPFAQFSRAQISITPRRIRAFKALIEPGHASCYAHSFLLASTGARAAKFSAQPRTAKKVRACPTLCPIILLIYHLSKASIDDFLALFLSFPVPAVQCALACAFFTLMARTLQLSACWGSRVVER